MTVDGIGDLNRIAVDLARNADRIGADTAKVVRRSGQQLAAKGQQFAPVDTSALQQSIGVDYIGDGRSGEMAATAGPTVDYGPFVEYGTSRMAPYAFMGPALDRVAPDFVAALEALTDPLNP